jgi:hypothetical protein
MKQGIFNIQPIIFSKEKEKGFGRMWWEQADKKPSYPTAR